MSWVVAPLPPTPKPGLKTRVFVWGWCWVSWLCGEAAAPGVAMGLSADPVDTQAAPMGPPEQATSEKAFQCMSDLLF